MKQIESLKLEAYEESTIDYAKDIVAFAKHLYDLHQTIQPYQLDFIEMLMVDNTLNITVTLKPVDFIYCTITVV